MPVLCAGESSGTITCSSWGSCTVPEPPAGSGALLMSPMGQTDTGLSPSPCESEHSRGAERAAKVVNNFHAWQKHLLSFHPPTHLLRCYHPISQVRKLRLKEVKGLVSVTQLVDSGAEIRNQSPSFFSRSFFSSTMRPLGRGGSCL